MENLQRIIQMNIIGPLFIVMLLLIESGVTVLVTLAKLAFLYMLLDYSGLTGSLSSGDTVCLTLFIAIIYKLSTK